MLGIGLRPRLKVRPSLLDLVSHGAVVLNKAALVDSAAAAATIASATPPDLDLDLPPLPATPLSTNNFDAATSLTATTDLPPEIIVELNPSASLPPSPSPSPSPSVMAPSGKKQTGEDTQDGAVFSISGPVVIAEKMIGCAMYELVSAAFPELRTIA